jgi:hypothetical protein
VTGGWSKLQNEELGKINENDVGWTCNMHGRYKIFVAKSCVKKTRDPSVSGRVILKWILQKIGCEIADWIRLVRARVQWRALGNAVTNIWIP